MRAIAASLSLSPIYLRLYLINSFSYIFYQNCVLVLYLFKKIHVCSIMQMLEKVENLTQVASSLSNMLQQFNLLQRHRNKLFSFKGITSNSPSNAYVLCVSTFFPSIPKKRRRVSLFYVT